MGHHLGFASLIGTPLGTGRPVTLFEAFRFNEDNPSISPSEFRGTARELRTDQNSAMVLQLNSTNRIYPTSPTDGDGWNPSHWRQRTSLGSDDYIGIMNPAVQVGENIIQNTLNPITLEQTNTYLSFADIAAFDVLGFDIDFNLYTPSPVILPPLLLMPLFGAVLEPDSDLTLTWDGEGADTVDIRVTDLGSAYGAVVAPTVLFEADGVSASSITVPSADLDLLAGHQYSWRVVGRQPLGFASSDIGSFDVRCFPDQNGDGLINFFDMSAYIALYDAGDPQADIAKPFGALNFFDLSEFVARFNAGCP